MEAETLEEQYLFYPWLSQLPTFLFVVFIELSLLLSDVSLSHQFPHLFSPKESHRGLH